MNVKIGTVVAQFLFWECLFPIFGIVLCSVPPTIISLWSNFLTKALNVTIGTNLYKSFFRMMLLAGDVFANTFQVFFLDGCKVKRICSQANFHRIGNFFYFFHFRPFPSLYRPLMCRYCRYTHCCEGQGSKRYLKRNWVEILRYIRGYINKKTLIAFIQFCRISLKY